MTDLLRLKREMVDEGRRMTAAYDRLGVTTGDAQSFLRFTRHVRRVLLHAGKLMVPTISDADTIFPERVAEDPALSLVVGERVTSGPDGLENRRG
jgi:hypothetical protein